MLKKVFIGLINKKKMDIPHTGFSWTYCITMWCMLCTSFRSTPNSAVSLNCDATHCPPFWERSDLRPSTANDALKSLLIRGCCCQANLCRATFSKKRKQVSFCKIITYLQ